MIPKIIHYCWFGGNPLPEDIKRYIASWKKYCPDYEIRQWNESNFDVTENSYCHEAYKAKKWAFVSDYVRLKVLYELGGIYLDTDVEVVKSFDSLLKYEAFIGFQSNSRIDTGIIGGCKGNSWIKEFLELYRGKHFFITSDTYDMTTNVTILMNFMKSNYEVQFNNHTQEFGDDMIILSSEYLSPKNQETGIITKTINTVTIHHFMGSWVSEKRKKYERELNLLRKRCTIIEKNWAIKYFTETILAYKVGGWHFVWECVKAIYFKRIK